MEVSKLVAQAILQHRKDIGVENPEIIKISGFFLYRFSRLNPKDIISLKQPFGGLELNQPEKLYFLDNYDTIKM